ncbi:unnamed protein product [Adineta steineri]|uniref:NAD(P)(+)--arginine ADP-ribosyltransferase n=1 Tax=Adineta steineri TaxID=433720 RepID=A0A815D2C2_9BILA|nr:unnamed protein product [Adineta steineri]CAF3568456.1 unnamed protein product [Adineta steineri]
MTATACTSRSFQTHQPRQRTAQSYSVIWVDGNVDEAHSDCQNILEQLRHVVNHVTICKEPEHSIKCLNNIDDQKVFIISSNDLGQDLVPQIHSMKNVHAIYIFCENKEKHEQWTKQWSKIKDVFTEIKPLCESLRKMAHQCDHNAIPMSFVSKQMAPLAAASNQPNLDQLEPTFMYSLLFKDIVLEIDDDDTKSVKDLVAYCRLQNVSESQLNEFQDEYRKRSTIWVYSRSSFLYSMLNRALRTFDIEAMIKMGFFIRNLHRQLESLQKEQLNIYKHEFMVYRGQGLTQQAFQHLLEIKDGLLSFNSFLSTSKEQQVAMIFAESILDLDNEIVGVIFMIRINLSQMTTFTTPFACVEHCSAFPQEDEILFSMHTVFRVRDIQQSIRNNRLWEVQLTLTDDNDSELADLTKRMKEEIVGKQWYRMGQLVLQVGEFYQAEILYNELLKTASSDSDRADIYQRLAETKYWQGQYKEVILFSKKSLEISHSTLAKDDSSDANTYNYMGLAYDSMGDYSKAVEFYEKSLEIRENVLPPNHSDLSQSYNNIALVYNNMGDYLKALGFYEKSIKIKEIALPSNHPDLAMSYNNIGLVYNNMGAYSKALEFNEKSHETFEKVLHPNHPYLAFTFSRFGRVYRGIKDYTKALHYFEKCIVIREQSLPEKHPKVAEVYSDTGDVHRLMGDYERALSFHRKALIIQENIQCNPLECATTYVNLGETYREMKEYAAALTYFQKGLDIRENKLPKNHLDLAAVYHNFSKLYLSTEQYSLAMKNVQQAIDIIQMKLPSTHHHLVQYTQTFEKIRKKT